MPTTPSWNDGIEDGERRRRPRRSARQARSTCASASSRIAASSVAPLAVDRVEHRARARCARAASSVSRHSMPSVMSASRPAALRRGPIAKPKSNALARRGSRPATANSAATPGCMRPARIRFSPCATRRRLLRVEPDDVGDGAERDQVEQRVEARLALASVNAPRCAQLGAQREQHVEHRRRRRRGACSRRRSPAGSD